MVLCSKPHLSIAGPGEVFAVCLSQQRLFLLSPSLPLMPSLGPQAFPLGCILYPTPKFLPLQPQLLLTTPHFRLLPALMPTLGSHPSSSISPSPRPSKGWGMGTPRLSRAQQSCILFPPLNRHLVSPSPRNCRVRGGSGYKWRGGVRGHSSLGEGQSRKRALTKATPAVPPPFAGGGSRPQGEGFPGTGEPLRPLPCHSLKERVPQD